MDFHLHVSMDTLNSLHTHLAFHCPPELEDFVHNCWFPSLNTMKGLGSFDFHPEWFAYQEVFACLADFAYHSELTYLVAFAYHSELTFRSFLWLLLVFLGNLGYCSWRMMLTLWRASTLTTTMMTMIHLESIRCRSKQSHPFASS
jgi:hypothetical protein